jgi:hypothetical protein
MFGARGDYIFVLYFLFVVYQYLIRPWAYGAVYRCTFGEQPMSSQLRQTQKIVRGEPLTIFIALNKKSTLFAEWIFVMRRQRLF